MANHALDQRVNQGSGHANRQEGESRHASQEIEHRLAHLDGSGENKADGMHCSV